MVLGSLNAIIQKEKFFPGILGFFINHNFMIRIGLKRAIQSNSKHLSGKLLDFGCGTKPYKKLFKNVTHYVGVDLKIDREHQNQNFVDAFYDGKTIPFGDNEFDAVLSTEVLEHVFNIDAILSEIHRVLKKGGKALITTPFMWEEHEMPYDFARYTTPALVHLYKSKGFKIVHHQKNGNYIHVVCQFALNYFKNILPSNEMLRLPFLIPFIFLFNTLGIIFGAVLPRDYNAYFNNIFVLEKI
jgi:ubiquinone/menaquinone biosynthesis C-methylase UbiE